MHHSKLNFFKFNLVTFVTVGLLLGVSGVSAGTEKISPRLARVLEKVEGPVPFIVLLKQLPPMPHSILGETTVADRERLIKQAVLQQQQGLRSAVSELANSNGVTGEASISRVKFFWTANAMMATGAADVIKGLSDRDDVVTILYDRKITLGPDGREAAELEGGFTYGLEKIGVPELRQAKPALTGKGVNVGIVDTGIDAKHPEFANKKIIFRDFVGTKTEPYDDNGHGTHVAGTISGVGANGTQIGIAPEVNLVIAKVFTAQGGATVSSLMRGMEWIADPDGNPNTNDKPRVVNNSWGGGMDGGDLSQDPFLPAVMTWVQLDIFPSFAAGNEGPGASTVGSPGGLPPAFAVGATDSNDDVAEFSSRGPVKGKMGGKDVNYKKPDVSAPGHKIVSAFPNGKYATLSGTSMATPHVTGSIAILFQAFPQLKVEQMKELVMKSSEDMGDTGKDNDYGAGRLQLAHAVETAAELMGNK
jgi:subtilisin family serine protease